MSIQKISLRNSILVLCIFAVGFLRLLNQSFIFTSLSNFTPIGAMALFGGTYFRNKTKSFLFPLLALLISDILLMQIFYPGMRSGVLYSGWGWTYASFTLIVLIGRWVKKVNPKNIIIVALSAAMTHWVITNFGVWLAGGLDISTGKSLDRNLHGFIQCYLQSLPFLKNMLVGNLMYGALMFGGFEYLEHRFTNLQLQKASHLTNA